MKKTAFNNIHKTLGGKMVDFAGFEMPVQYEGIIAEHKAVRNSVGVFDVSHMGEVEIHGNDAFDYVQKLTTNDVSKLQLGKVQYSSMCYTDGGVVDDLLVYNCGKYFLLVINAANIEKDLEWMNKNKFGDVEIKNVSDDISLLAVQGPNSLNTLQKLTKFDLSIMEYYTFTFCNLAGQEVLLSRTGYTGEKICFEIYSSSEIKKSEELWNAIFEAGQEYEIKPAGLGARDTLRLEYAYRLYGNDMNEKINILEAGLGWITKLDKGIFNGSDALKKAKADGLKRKVVGFSTDEKLIARQGAVVYSGENKIGIVTSGNISPMLNKNIGMALIDEGFNKTGTDIQIDIRGKKVNAKVVKTPFLN
ncbi:MAG: glycine cleavage system aminomethyltransferase GcvT [Ignavibacteria bacterium]|nr:glycine cleavage system aminomethyltransferase GcvT [Ignavibacteria bacterium]